MHNIVLHNWRAVGLAPWGPSCPTLWSICLHATPWDRWSPLRVPRLRSEHPCQSCTRSLRNVEPARRTAGSSWYRNGECSYVCWVVVLCNPRLWCHAWYTSLHISHSLCSLDHLQLVTWCWSDCWWWIHYCSSVGLWSTSFLQGSLWWLAVACVYDFLCVPHASVHLPGYGVVERIQQVGKGILLSFRGAF